MPLNEGVTPTGETFACSVPGCSRVFSGRRGLGVHISRAHPEQSNASVVITRTRARWSEEETRLLARAEAQILHRNPRAEPIMNDALRPHYNGRTKEAIKKQRQKPEYRSYVEVALAELACPSAPNPPTPHEESPAQTDVTAAFLEELRPINTRHAVAIKELLQTYQASGSVSQDQLLEWVMHATNVQSFEPQRPSRVERRRIDEGTARVRRRGSYKKTQELWRKCQCRAAEEILNPKTASTASPSVDAMFSTWSEIFNKPSIPVDENTCTEKSTSLSGIWTTVTAEEIANNELDRNTASGLDGITVSAWRRVPPVIRAAYYYLVMGVGGFHPVLEKGRTIFIAKKQGSTDPREQRPITVTSVIVRQLNKILAKRITTHHNWDVRQRAFLPVDGCAENLVALQSLINDAKTRLRQIHVGSFDVAKAFDSISHEAIIRVVESYGAPHSFVRYLQRSYELSCTVLQYKGHEKLVGVRRGVRQGDPLSPVLFNLAIEVVLKKLSSDVGYRVDEETKVNALSYADDIMLIASTKQGLQKLMDTFASELAKFGLLVNPSKCSILSIVPDGKNKKFKVLTEPQFHIGEEMIKQINVLDVWKYLGINFVGVKVQGGVKGFKEKLDRISRAPLKPQQRLVLLKRYFLPQYTHSLVFGRLELPVYKRLDIIVRGYVKKWLHMPKDVTTPVFHTSVPDGGLGIPSLLTEVPRLKQARFDRLANSESSIMRSIATLGWMSQILEKLRSCLRRYVPEGDGKQLKQYWATQLYKSVDGSDLELIKGAKESYSWIDKDSHVIKGKDYVGSLHTRYNCLPSRVRTYRGRAIDKSCRAGCSSDETSYHIIQKCGRTHNGRILRHDKVANIVANELSSQGWIVAKEPHLQTSQGLRKPDIVATNDERITVIDVQVVTSSNARLSHFRKARKYESIEGFNSILHGLYGSSKAIDHLPLTITYKGIWYLESLKNMYKMGLSTKILAMISRYVVQGSRMNFNQFMRSTSRSSSRPS